MSPDLNTLDYHASYGVCTQFNKREELRQGILSAARSISKAAGLRKFNVLWSHDSENASKQTENRHIEQFA